MVWGGGLGQGLGHRSRVCFWATLGRGREGKESQDQERFCVAAAAVSPGWAWCPPPAAHSLPILAVHPTVPSYPSSPCWSGCLLGRTDFKVSYQPAIPATGSTAESGIRAAPPQGKYRDFPSTALGRRQASSLLKHASGLGTPRFCRKQVSRADGMVWLEPFSPILG